MIYATSLTNTLAKPMRLWTRDERYRMMFLIGGIGLFVLGLILFFGTNMTAFAAPAATTGVPDTTTDAGAATAKKAMIDGIINVVCSIAQIIGVIFGVVGILKFAIAHANENGGDQQKAAMMIATGIILFVIPTIIKSVNFSNLIEVAKQN